MQKIIPEEDEQQLTVDRKRSQKRTINYDPNEKSAVAPQKVFNMQPSIDIDEFARDIEQQINDGGNTKKSMKQGSIKPSFKIVSQQRIRIQFKTTKLDSRQKDIVEESLEFTQYKYKYKQIEQQEIQSQKKAGMKNVGNYFDILLQQTDEFYQIPKVQIDDNYKAILKELGITPVIQNKNRIKKPVYNLEVIDFDFKNIPDEVLTMKEFQERYQNFYFYIQINAVVAQIETLIFALKKQIIQMVFTENTTMVYAGFILCCLDKDNYDNSIEDNLISLKFIQNHREYTQRALKKFFKIIQTGNVIFENLSYLKIKLIKSEEYIEAKKRQDELKQKQQSKQKIDSMQDVNAILQEAQTNARRPSVFQNNIKSNLGELDIKRLSEFSKQKVDQIEDDYNLVEDFQNCKIMCRKIYRSLCTQLLINNYEDTLKVKFKDEENESDRDQVLAYLKNMHNISKQHQILCQNELIYKELQRKKLKKLYLTANILPNFEEFNLRSFYTIKHTKQYVEDVVESSPKFIKEYLKLIILISVYWTLIGTFLPLRVLTHSVKHINAYFNTAGNVEKKTQFLPQILATMAQLSFKQLQQAGSLVLIVLTDLIVHKDSKSQKDTQTTDSLYALYIFYWIYYVMVVSILEMAKLVKKYYKMINTFTEEMHDINEFQISQKNNYVEFLENIEDQYMKNIIPTIPKKPDTQRKLGFQISEHLKKAQFYEKHQKFWVSIPILLARYVMEEQPIVSKDPDYVLKKIYSIQRQGYNYELKQQFKITFFIVLRVIGLPIIVHFLSEGFEHSIVLALTMAQSLMIYALNLIPSGFDILKGQRQKLMHIKRVVNMITQQEIKGSPREVPLINMFCITSLEGWHNMTKLTYGKSRRSDIIKDIALTIHGFVALIMICILISDAFGLFWEKFMLIQDLKFIIMYMVDLIIILFIVFRSLWFKVEHNYTYNIIIEELDQIISLVQDITRSLPEMIYQFEKDKLNDDEDDFLVNQGSVAVVDTLLKIGIYQIKRNAKIRTFIVENRTQLSEDEEIIISQQYTNDLLKKLLQVREEFEQDSIKKAAMFLGLVRVDDKLVKQIVIAGLIAGITSGMQLVVAWIQEKN